VPVHHIYHKSSTWKYYVCQGSPKDLHSLSRKLNLCKGLNNSALYCRETLCVPRVSTNQHYTVGKRYVSQGSQQISNLLSGNVMCPKCLNNSALYCRETLCAPRVSTIQHSTGGKRYVPQGSQQISTLLAGNVWQGAAMRNRVSRYDISLKNSLQDCGYSQEPKLPVRMRVCESVFFCYFISLGLMCGYC
jgi:hypothetical protein